MARVDPVEVPVKVRVERSAGDWWRLSARVADVIAFIDGSELSHWSDSLRFLVRDAQRQAGAECVHEVRDFQHEREAGLSERRSA